MLPIIFIFAFLLRLFPFIHGDFYMLADQARDLLLVKQIVILHKLPLIGARAGFGGLFHGPLWLFMVSPFFFFAHGNPFYSLVPLFLLVSIGVVVAGFFIGNWLYGFWMGILFAALLAISSSLVTVVPFSTNAQVMPLVLLLFLYASMEFLRGKNIFFIFMLLFTGLGMHFESAFAITLIPFSIVALILRRSFPVKEIGWGIVAFVLAVSNFLFFEIRHRFLMTQSVIGLLHAGSHPLKGWEKYSNLFFRIHDRLVLLWNYFFGSSFSGISYQNLLIAGILLVGLILAVRRMLSRKVFDKEYIFIFLIPFIIFGLYILYPYPLWDHYLLPLSVSFVFLLFLSLKELLSLKRGDVLVGAIVFVLWFPSLQWLSGAYTNGLNVNSYTASDGSYKNQLQVVDWIFQDAHGKPFGYFVYNQQIFTYNMDYLLWWRNTYHYHTTAESKKYPITYLVMYEHAANDDNAYAFWKTNVIRTKGKVLLTKVFNGNITVEKLEIPGTEEAPDPNYYQDLIFR